MTDDREPEPQPGTHLRIVISLAKPIEDEWQKFRRNAHAVVGYADFHIVLFVSNGDFYTPAGRGEFNGIRQQIPNDLLQPVWISIDEFSDLCKTRYDADILRLRQTPHRLDGSLNHRSDLNGLHFQMQLSRDDS